MVATKPRVSVTAKITSKGQITLPKAVRDHFGLQPGQEVEFVEDDTGAIRIRRYLDPHRFEKWRGYLKHLKGRSSDELVREMRGE
jgi:antitoxin PrlF